MKRKIVISAADARSFRVASNLLDELADVKASPNTIERICLDAGGELQATADENWKGVLTGDEDPREQLRVVLQYLENNLDRMKYDGYRMQGLPTTSAWMESAVKEVNYRIKGTEMFWNNPKGAEAILHIRAARLSDDGRLHRFLEGRSGSPTVRKTTESPQLAA